MGVFAGLRQGPLGLSGFRWCVSMGRHGTQFCLCPSRSQTAVETRQSAGDMRKLWQEGEVLRLRIDLHVHSCFSPDSVTRVEEIIELAKKRGLDGVAIVDHNTLGGGLAAWGLNKDPDFIVIPGTEYSTEHGHIVGLFLHEEITVEKSETQNSTVGPVAGTRLPFEDVVKAIHDQGGLAVIAHPFQSRLSLPAHVFTSSVRVDALEGFNSRATTRSNPKANALAAKCADEYGVPAVGGSDAHLSWEIGRGYTEVTLDRDCAHHFRDSVCIKDSHHLVKRAILMGRVKAFGRPTSRAVVPITELIKARKRKTYGRVPLILCWLLVSMLGPVGFWVETLLIRVKASLSKGLK